MEVESPPSVPDGFDGCGPRCVSSLTPRAPGARHPAGSEGQPSSGTIRPPTASTSSTLVVNLAPASAAMPVAVAASVSARTVGPAPLTAAATPAARSLATRSAVRG